ncbi:MAG: high light inducible protein [Fischerella sp.]|nr:high light inducible protein [Fischerella sp.]
MKSDLVTEEFGRLNNYAIEPNKYMMDQPRFGFTQYAEKLNGRLAMIGLVLFRSWL